MGAICRRLPLHAWTPYAVLALMLALTVIGTAYVARSNEARDVLRFRAAADEARQLIDIRLNTYIELLRVGSGLFAAKDDLTGDEFRAFARGLRVHERYPGIQAIGFAVRIGPARLPDVESQLHAVADADARVWPAGLREEYVVTLLLEPLDRQNRAGLGYDMSTDPVLRTAMDRARDMGVPAASGRVRLVQPNDMAEQRGFVIYMPVYGAGVSTASTDERRLSLIGYVFSPYRVHDLLDGVLAYSSTEPLSLVVYDGLESRDSTHLHASWPDAALGGVDRQLTHQLDVAGRPWTIVFAAAPGFGDSFPWSVPMTLLVGTLLSLAVFGVSFVQLRAWTQERRGEAQLREVVTRETEARAAAQAADHAKDEFLAAVSHELRTPLNAMLSWLTILRSGGLQQDRFDHALEVIQRNARTQARLIEDLLDESRIMTGKVRLDLYALQLGPIVNTVLEGLRPGADAKSVRLHASVAAGAPDIMGDAARLQQLVWNLLSNAIKFTSPNGDVYIDLRTRNGQVELIISDTGVGIAPEFLPHVFERFRQANGSMTRAYGGVGLGLAIVRHLVELHGGAIEAHSEGRERGATFVVRFPAAAPLSSSRLAASQQPQWIPLEGVRVLVVDNEADTREMIAEALSASGASVLPAGSAEEALVLLRQHDADILVSDIGMPEVDGYMLVRRVRALPGPTGRIAAVALTAYGRPRDGQNAIDAGFQAYLTKPVDLEALRKAVALLARRR